MSRHLSAPVEDMGDRSELPVSVDAVELEIEAIGGLRSRTVEEE